MVSKSAPLIQFLIKFSETAGSVSRVEAARAERAARAAEEAAGSAVLDLRKCCDHPQLTSLWRRQVNKTLNLDQKP